ncbi:MAG: phage regulatory CII family protein [Halomonas sp.]|nr:phage regulatory CII family protein [Halomonas sp.]
MNPQDAFYQTVHDHPGSAESLAPRMGMSAAVLRNKANPNNEYNKPTLGDVDKAMALTGDYRVLDALAANHGGIFVRMDKCEATTGVGLLGQITHVWSVEGDVGRCIEEMLDDGRIEPHELERVKEAVYHLQQSLAELVQSFEGAAR